MNTAPLHLFVVPPVSGSPTGGTLFNRRLLAALARQGVAVRAAAPEQVGEVHRLHPQARVFVDTLFLDHMPAIAAALVAPARPGLLVHYLPSLVAQGAVASVDALTQAERAALAAAGRCVVPSAFMVDVLGRLGVSGDAVALVEPGYEAPSSAAARQPDPARVELVLVANLVPGKGVLELLDALARAVGGDERGRLQVVGGHDADPVYAAACVAAADRTTEAGLAVTLVGALEPDACLSAVADADALVSASRMESFGMAIAEAAACGVPVVARTGGNVEFLVDPAAGGELVGDAEALAAACLALVRDPSRLRKRRSLARAAARQRPWSQVATDFLATW